MSVLRVAIVGAGGRLGTLADRVLSAEGAFEVVARLGSSDDLAATIRASRPDVALEVTHAGLGARHAHKLLELGVRPLVGTSGVTLEETAELDRLARSRGLGGLVVPNFSLGMWLLQRAALAAALHFEQCEIVEMHHSGKQDAPSGTALDTRYQLAALVGGEVPIHSVRLPGLYAHQIVMFGARGETYTLRHDMSTPEAFGPGILAGLAFAATALGVGRGIGRAFEERERAAAARRA